MGAMLRFALRVGLLGSIFVLSYAGEAGLSGGVTLEWHDLHYAIATKNEGKLKHILSGLHGRATPGQLVAIMGPTGPPFYINPAALQSEVFCSAYRSMVIEAMRNRTRLCSKYESLDSDVQGVAKPLY